MIGSVAVYPNVRGKEGGSFILVRSMHARNWPPGDLDYIQYSSSPNLSVVSHLRMIACFFTHRMHLLLCRLDAATWSDPWGSSQGRSVRSEILRAEYLQENVRVLSDVHDLGAPVVFRVKSSSCVLWLRQTVFFFITIVFLVCSDP